MTTPTKTSHVLPSRIVDVTLATITLLLLTVGVSAGAAPGNDNKTPDLGSCQNLRTLAGNKVAYHVRANLSMGGYELDIRRARRGVVC